MPLISYYRLLTSIKFGNFSSCAASIQEQRDERCAGRPSKESRGADLLDQRYVATAGVEKGLNYCPIQLPGKGEGERAVASYHLVLAEKRAHLVPHFLVASLLPILSVASDPPSASSHTRAPTRTPGDTSNKRTRTAFGRVRLGLVPPCFGSRGTL